MTSYVKQYGAQRTGTNVVRTVLSDYLSDVVVLMHVLGDKHSAPVDFAALRRQPCTAPGDWVEAATRQAPSFTTDLDGDPAQALLVRELADGIETAVATGELRVVVSVRDPYPWMASMGRLHNWLRYPVNICDQVGEDALAGCAELCAQLNDRVARWLDLVERTRHATIVRHERLNREPLPDLVADLAQHLALATAAPAPVALPGHVLPAHWDDHHSAIRPDIVPQGPTALPVALSHIVTRHIDWELMGGIGYAPSPRAGG
ncbi:MAG: hypothetical protein LC799_24910 [Actinobacteria bacterium]|nr:hypothetical protein [Actinomycetota bacterium]